MELMERIGIKGSPEQLQKSIPLLKKLLRLLAEPANFPVEVHLNKGELDKLERVKEITDIIKLIKPKPSRIAIHIPFQFRGKAYNPATHEKEIWENSIEMLRICLTLVENIEKCVKTETILVAHGYALGEYEKTEEGLRFINHECDLLRIYQAFMKFPSDERKKIGIETTGTGPCSAPKDLIALARSTDCFIVQDVAHLLREFYIDETNKTHEREYNNLERLEAGVKKMLPLTRHWHVCQHDGGPVHYDGHLADRGILDWSRFIPLLVESFQQNQATAIIEVRNLNLEKPIETFGSLLLIRSLVKEHLQKKAGK